MSPPAAVNDDLVPGDGTEPTSARDELRQTILEDHRRHLTWAGESQDELPPAWDQRRESGLRPIGGSTPNFGARLVFPQDFDDSDLSDSHLSERSPLFGRDTPESGRKSSSSEPPNDKLRFVWFVFYLLGMTTLLPWNFFIAVNDYWEYKFRDPSGNATHTDLQKEFTSYLAIASNIPNAVFVILNVFYGRSFRLNFRIIGSLSIMSSLFIGVILMARIDSDDWQEWFLYSTLLIVVLLNICTAIFQGGLIGVAGKFPSHYIGGMMSGQALGGIFPALVNIAVIAFQVSPPKIGFFCFLVAFCFVLLSLAVYCAMQTTAFFQFYAGNSARNVPNEVTGVQVSYERILRTTWKYLFCVFTNFTVTLAVFPSITVLIVSQYRDDPDNTFATVYFTPVACFLLFNCGDYAGRILASAIKWPGPTELGQDLLLTMACLRIGFIPLFMLCNMPADLHNVPVVFNQDWQYYILMSVFSLSNGYVGNLCMMNGPRSVEAGEVQEAVASLLVAVLVLGIGFGSAMSYPLVSLL